MQDEHGQPPSRFSQSRLSDRGIDELIGLCRGVLADGVLAESEVRFLADWLDRYRHIADQWPAVVLYKRIREVFADGVMDSDEERDLLATLLDLTGAPILGESAASMSTALPLDDPPPTLIFGGWAYCSTCTIACGKRSQVTRNIRRQETPMAVVAGIDGCPAGWVCLIKDLSTGDVQAHILATISDLLGLAPRPEMVLVDVPIGLTAAGPRMCDLEARAYLKAPRASSVFPAPIRPTLVAASYDQACEIGAAADGRKLSQQSWAIVPKIREVDTFLRTDSTLNQWIREVHPEVSFWAWNGGKAMVHRKKLSAGRGRARGTGQAGVRGGLHCRAVELAAWPVPQRRSP